MALPKQVQKQKAQLEAFDKRQAEAVESAGVETPAEAAPSPEVAQTDSTTTPKVDEPTSEKPSNEAPPQDSAVDFEQKYNSLQGKYNSEVPSLHSKIKALEEQVSSLVKTAQEAKEAEAQKPKEPVSLVTPAEIEEYGEDLLDVQRRIAREEFERDYRPVLDAQKRELEELKNAGQTTNSEVAEVQFLQRLSVLVPDFEEVNKDPRWFAWLNEHDPMVNGPRRTIVEHVFNAGDAPAVANYVGLFKKSVATATPPQATRQAEFEKQVSPARSVASTPSPQAAGPSYTLEEAQSKLRQAQKLARDGNYDRANKLEADVAAAFSEGRVEA